MIVGTSSSLILVVLFCIKCNQMTIVRFDEAMVGINLSGENGQKTQAARELNRRSSAHIWLALWPFVWLFYLLEIPFTGCFGNLWWQAIANFAVRVNSHC